MKLKNLFHISVIILVLFHSCKQERVEERAINKLLIRLNSDSSEVELSGLADQAIEELMTDSLPDSLWTNFFAVYEETPDPEMRDFQPALKGIYIIDAGLIRFKPRDNFRDNGLYFARCYTKLLLQDAESLIETRELFESNGYTEYKFKVSKK